MAMAVRGQMASCPRLGVAVGEYIKHEQAELTVMAVMALAEEGWIAAFVLTVFSIGFTEGARKGGHRGS